MHVRQAVRFGRSEERGGRDCARRVHAPSRNICTDVRARVLGCTVDLDSDLGRSGHV